MSLARLAPRLFFGLYALVFVVCAISPFDRSVWWAENLPILGIAMCIAFLGRKRPFSPVAYAMMLVLLVLHSIGGHYTFERVPFGWVTNLFGFHRNHYDRMAHFSVGFYAYAIAEVIYRTRAVNSRLVLLSYPVLAILAVAAGYELFEWGYAVSADPTAGIAVLGSQGDVWDAQKDMLSDGLGALFATLIFALTHRGTGERLPA
jgi:putative membrane protein